MRRKDGYTLVELLVTIAASSIIMLAAASLLLLGYRVLHSVQKEAEEQQTVRIVLSVLEDMTASGRFDRVQSLSSGGWQLLDGTRAVLMYDKRSECLSSGSNVLLEGLTGSTVSLDGSLLTFSFETEEHHYGTSVYCRMVPKAHDEGIDKEVIEKAEEEGNLLPTREDLTETVKGERYAFLQALADQYGSTGRIMDSDVYFSEWYIGGYDTHPGWGPNTPWCACFLSWAADMQKGSLNDVPKFAEVDNGMQYFMEYRNSSDPEKSFWADRKSEYTPIPGDYIFFDWSGGNDPDHAGAVLYVDESTKTVFTLEGNNGGRVTICSYSLDDPSIIGYGILDWKGDSAA